MTELSPITPPQELVQQWEEQFLQRPTINGCFIQSYIAAKAARWGADMELEACCEWLCEDSMPKNSNRLRNARRPKPPSLKEQALASLAELESPGRCDEPGYESLCNTIRRALEALPND
jgi:hypothetical protein